MVKWPLMDEDKTNAVNGGICLPQIVNLNKFVNKMEDVYRRGRGFPRAWRGVFQGL